MARVGLASVLAAGVAVATAGSAGAAVRVFSYDPANDATRRTAGGLTFEFEQRFVFQRVLKVQATEGQAHAVLKPAGEAALGHGGLSGVIGAGAHERDLYEIEPSAEGADMIHAFCPGSHHGWLAFGHIAQFHDLRVQVLGDSPDGGPAHVCHTLDFSWRGEWKLPSGQNPGPKDMLEPTFPF